MKKLCTDAGKDKLNRLAAAVVIIMLLPFMLYLTGSAFLETVSISTETASGELAVISPDNIFLNAILLALMLAALYLFYKHSGGVSLRRLELLLLLWTLALGLAFIVSVKLCAPWFSDSYLVTYAAQRAAQDDLSSLDSYFVRYPFQLGFVLYEEIFFRLSGLVIPGLPEGYYCLMLQGVNLLWLLLSYHGLIRISLLLFNDERLSRFTAVLLLLFQPPVFSCTFLYGNIPAFALGVCAVWMFAEFTQGGRFVCGLLSALAMAAAVMLKLNLMIFFAAVAAVWLVELFRKFRFKSLLCMALMCVCVLSCVKAPQTVYERRSGKSFGEGIPMLAWMAMGLSEGHAGPGWYKEEHTVTAFRESGFDSQATAEKAGEAIRERLSYFGREPGEALRFFSVKLRSQWNEPSYESLWINKVQSSYGEKQGLYGPLIGGGEKRTVGFMGQIQQLLFLGTLLSLLELWSKRDTRRCVLLVIILGGLLYHLLFEAKSQYSLGYVMLMAPMAACGLTGLFRRIETR